MAGSISISDMEKLNGDVPQASRRTALTKADLVKNISATIGITHHEAECVLETILSSIVRGLRTGDKVELRGFGSFRTRQRQGRIARNPKTGARVEVPAKSIPYFSPSKELKDSLAELASRDTQNR